MIEIFSVNNCIYCEALKQALDEAAISYKATETVNKGSYPQLYYNGELKFLGLPYMLELLAFITEIKNKNKNEK
jgi:glutaredoxin